ncbi:DUF7336 domain-containing protein [Bacillus subtilis]|uniref:DUF7336 domain-containing protein n=1 Tax=Bacillus subtilis TaxID=1423 RepID=UPI0027239A6F|nr:hypothetical protein [Bacillus subtilis]MDP0481846.1 hypothetical protein [Bacillus subtilis]WIT28141.1 hypothetical protein [Bacillus phage SPbetaL8]
MRLYLLYESYPHEGGHVYGVFSTEEKAKKYIEEGEVDFHHAVIKEVNIDSFTRITI